MSSFTGRIFSNIENFILGEDPEFSQTKVDIVNYLCDKKGISDFSAQLGYEDGVYSCKEGFALLYRVFVPFYLGDEVENSIEKLFRTNFPDGTIANFFTYASCNISNYLAHWKKIHNKIPNIKHPDVLAELISKKAEYFEEAAANNLWQGIDARPKIHMNYISFFFPFSKDNQPEKVYRTAHMLQKKIMAELKGAKFGVEIAEPDELITVLSDILNPAFKGSTKWNHGLDIKEQILEHDTRIKIEKEQDGEEANLCLTQRGKKKHYIGYWFKGYAPKPTLWEFSNILFPFDSKDIASTIPGNFFMSMQIRVDKIEKRKNRMLGKAAFAKKQSKGNPLEEYIPKIGRKREHSQYVSELIEDGKVPLEASMFLFLSDDDKDKLEFVSSSVKSKFTNANYELTREIDESLFSTFMECLPLNHILARNKNFIRYSTMFDANVAALIPLVGGVGGSKIPACLYLDRKYGLMGFDQFHTVTNFNVVKAAASGGGKSFSECDSDVCNLSMGRVIRVIDKGGSYKTFSDLIGGQYIEFEDRDRPCFNPFTNLLEGEDGSIHEDDMAQIVPLVGILCGVDLNDEIAKSGEQNITAQYASIIADAISTAYANERTKCGMSHVYNELKKNTNRLSQDLADAMKPYGVGHYQHYWNGPENINYSSDYVVLELERLGQKEPRLQGAVLYSIIIKVFREFFLAKLHGDYRRKILKIDEAWDLLKKLSAANAMEAAARTFRKHGCSLTTITQGVEDFYSSATTQAIYNNSAHIQILSSKKQDINRALDAGKLSVDEFETTLIHSLRTVPGYYSEIFIKNEIFSGVARLTVDKFAYWTYTTQDAEKIVRNELLDAGYKPVEAIRALASSLPVGEIFFKSGMLDKNQIDLILFLQETHRDYIGLPFGEVAKKIGVVTEIQIREALAQQETFKADIRSKIEIAARR